MGLADLFLVNLCLNSTCGDESLEVNDPSKLTKNYLSVLANELKGKHFKVTTLQNEPLSYAIKQNGSWVGKGIAFDFINLMKEKYGFDYSVVLPNEDIIGNENSGIMELLHQNLADVSAAFVPVIPTLWEYTHFSTNLDIGEWVVLMRRPTESASGSGLLAPFTTPVWILIILSIFVVGPLIYLMVLARVRLCGDKESRIYPLPSCVWFVYSGLLKQGSPLNPSADSSRIMFATWWIFITILTAFYTANLTAFLTLSKFTLPINNVKDIKAKNYHWVTKKGNAIDEIVSDPEVVSDMVEALRGSQGEYISLNDSVILDQLVEKSNIMFIREKPIVDHIMYNAYIEKTRLGYQGSDGCNFVITTWSVLKIARAFAYSRKFKYRSLFDSNLQHLVESGIFQYMTNEGLPNTKICPLDLGSNERQLKNVDLMMTYYIVMGGFIISAVIFTGELIVKLYQNRKKTKRSNKATLIHNMRNGAHVRVIENFGKEETKHGFPQVPPPPPYHTLFSPPYDNVPNGKKKYINGRMYWVVKSVMGETRLIPVRQPSAVLFQHIAQ